MRDIKFRAWDKKHNEMVPDLICFYKDGGISHNNHFNSDISPFRGYMWDSRNLEVMQYTGLKDKNGKEIYEGDIVKYKYTSREQIAEIKYNKEKLGFDFADNKVNLSYAYNFRQINNIEVIGNIYENSELLKED